MVFIGSGDLVLLSEFLSILKFSGTDAGNLNLQPVLMGNHTIDPGGVISGKSGSVNGYFKAVIFQAIQLFRLLNKSHHRKKLQLGLKQYLCLSRIILLIAYWIQSP